MEFARSMGPGSEAEIAAIEQATDWALPDAYRAFLLEHGGGQPFPDSFDYADGSEGSTVDLFYYAVPPERDYSAIRNIRKVFADALPAELLAIGRDPGGNQICLAGPGARHGAILFWDHDYGEVTLSEQDFADGAVRLVAADFDAFLQGLFEFSLDD